MIRFAPQSLPRRFVAALLVLVLWAGAVPADERAAEEFVRVKGDEAIAIVSDGSLSAEQFKSEFRDFVEAGFDVPVVGRFALGPYWRAATDAQKDAYQAAFFDYIVDTYAARFQQYAGETLAVDGARAVNDTEALVSSQIVRPEAANINIDWHVRFANGEYRIIDIIIEGLRLGLTLREQFSSVIRAGGGDLDILIQDLRAHTAAGGA